MEQLQEYAGVKVGDELPRRQLRVTQEMVNKYADVSHDYNPLHTDEEFAKTTFYGRTIAHGLYSIGVLSSAMSEWNAKGWANGGQLDIAFLSPLYPGEEVAVGGTVKAIEKTADGAVYARVEIDIQSMGKPTIGGFASARLDG